MLRVAGSLITNQVRAYDLLRMFGREGHRTPLGDAFAEYGRIDQTMHLLALVDPVCDTYRRLMDRQLTVQESRHRLARSICHGGRGQTARPTARARRTSSPPSAWSSTPWSGGTPAPYDAAVARLRAEGHDIKDGDVARLSPLKDRHINMLGRYLFDIKPAAPARACAPSAPPTPSRTLRTRLIRHVSETHPATRRRTACPVRSYGRAGKSAPREAVSWARSSSSMSSNWPWTVS
ncbi:Tn3 family transposase [Streptomyces olivaceiscleroticus]|uniref:Tn3 transposase DDE domain-containing protein n=1 Tax=Streptomyces olivaceiscleroticus TaxID=68245 RepID=A0ABN0ZLR1_9ACTN